MLYMLCINGNILNPKLYINIYLICNTFFFAAEQARPGKVMYVIQLMKCWYTHNILSIIY